jgi:hypothetical protein
MPSSKYVFAAICLIVAAHSGAFAQGDVETLNIDQSLTVDRIGDGVMVLKFTLTAAQFQNWQGKYGQNQSLLRRDLVKFVSQFETHDWSVDQNQMDRVVKISCKIKGGVVYKGNGRFEFRVPKQWRGGDRAGTTFSYNFVQSSGGMVVQNNVKLTLPEGASRFSMDNSETGERIIQYILPVAGSSVALMWGGAAALLTGLLMVGFAVLRSRQPTGAAARA